MKGGDVVTIHALEAPDAAGLLKTMNVTIVMTGDEEDSGDPLNLAREALIAAAKGADYDRLRGRTRRSEAGGDGAARTTGWTVRAVAPPRTRRRSSGRTSATALPTSSRAFSMPARRWRARRT